MQTAISKDGTTIAYDKQGSGPLVILVDGAFCSRSFGPMPGLAKLLAPHFTVINYDRRGRGDSGDTQPYALEREVEDIEALIDANGGSTYLLGLSSGAALSFEAAAHLGSKVKKLAMYEAPYNSDPTSLKAWQDYTAELAKLIDAGKNGDAAALFMTFVGTPKEQVEGMRHAPVWQALEAIAPTLRYDSATLGKDRVVPVERAKNITTDALIMAGGAGVLVKGGGELPFMQQSARQLSEALPHAEMRILEDQTHDVNLEVLAAAVEPFFAK